MSRRAVIAFFKDQVEPELHSLGFVGKRGHFVRKTGPVTQVIELQHSIYGGRVTANLGLDLEFLKPLVRWISSPALGPHAHDSTRWIRIGLVRPDRADRWWSFEPDALEECKKAVRDLGLAIIEHGVPWLESEADAPAFMRYARARLERSRCAERPDGTYLDLRLMAAILAWGGELEEARHLASLARLSWEDERARLIAARAQYQRARARTKLASVPDIQAELEALISTTRASRRSPGSPASARPRSRSGRLRSSPA